MTPAPFINAPCKPHPHQFPEHPAILPAFMAGRASGRRKPYGWELTEKTLWVGAGGGGMGIYRGLEGLGPWESVLRTKLHSCLSGAGLGSFVLVFSRYPWPLTLLPRSRPWLTPLPPTRPLPRPRPPQKNPKKSPKNWKHISIAFYHPYCYNK